MVIRLSEFKVSIISLSEATLRGSIFLSISTVPRLIFEIVARDKDVLMAFDLPRSATVNPRGLKIALCASRNVRFRSYISKTKDVLVDR